ncbi:MAG: phosphoribosylformylglycinamidine synthase subunit PurS, partial [Phycisphaerae bacterium]
MIYRIDVRDKASEGGPDRSGTAVRKEIEQLGTTLGPISTWRIFLISTSAAEAQVRQSASELLADPVVEEAVLRSQGGHIAGDGRSVIEVHLKPGVMDPVAGSTEMALRDMGIADAEVRTGRAFVIEGKADRAALERVATRILANPVIESVHFDTHTPTEFAHGHASTFKLRHVQIRELTDEQLTKLSREGHLFLSLAEMRAIQAYYREQKR